MNEPGVAGTTPCFRLKWSAVLILFWMSFGLVDGNATSVIQFFFMAISAVALACSSLESGHTLTTPILLQCHTEPLDLPSALMSSY